MRLPIALTICAFSFALLLGHHTGDLGEPAYLFFAAAFSSGPVVKTLLVRLATKLGLNKH